MDKDAQDRIFETLQRKFNINELTQDKINEFLRNKSSLRLDTWKEKKEGQIRTRTRWEQTKFSTKKDNIARDMAKVFDIANTIKQADSVSDLIEARSNLDNFKSTFKLTKENSFRLTTSIGRKQKNVENRELRRERSKNLTTLSKLELSQMGITKRTKPSGLAKRYDLELSEAEEILKDLNI